MKINKSNLMTIAGILFLLAAAVSAFGKSGNIGMGTVWLALGVAFLALAKKRPRNSG
jgi:hypothetical protein